MNWLKIKTKKDWCIAFIFATLVVYGITTIFSDRFQSFLLNYGNPGLTNMNQPGGYGNLIITVLIMTVLLEILFVLYHKSKMKLIAAFTGIAFAALLFVGYLVNCNLIVSVAGTEAPISVHANGWAVNIDINMDEKQKEQLVSYCETLHPVSAGREKELEDIFYNSDGNITGNSLLIWITYPKKYGHNYDLMVCVYNDMIFIRKGYNNNQKEVVTFFEDNGLLALVNEIKK